MIGGWLPPNIGGLLGLAVIECLAMAVLVVVCWERNLRSQIYARPWNYVLGDGAIWLGFVVYAALTPGPVAWGQAVVAYSVLLAGAGVGTITMYAWKWTRRQQFRRAVDAAEAGQHGPPR